MPHKLLPVLLTVVSTLIPPFARAQSAPDAPVRVGVAGLTHGHVGWILGRGERGDIVVVGIAEADRELAARYAAEYGFSLDLVYESVEEMLEATRPEAVTAFNDVAAHLPTVEAAARQGVHVMVEKPLHFSLDAARRMKAVADSAGIHLLTNYETTWYPTTAHAHEIVRSGELGVLRKIVVRDGHPGPSEIGVGPEFLEWLTDPARNGGGALVDFGCYGANLITWLLDGERPLSVTALTQTLKPDLYPDVDDEATILLEYVSAQGIIQASWNWPFSRKDMEVYGTAGYVLADNDVDLRVRLVGGAASGSVDEAGDMDGANLRGSETVRALQLDRDVPEHLRDPFAYLTAVVRGQVDPRGSLSSIEVNMVVVEILDAALRSAREGITVVLEE